MMRRSMGLLFDLWMVCGVAGFLLGMLLPIVLIVWGVLSWAL